MEGMIKRALDWAGYLGIAVLAAAALLPFLPPKWTPYAANRVWWGLVIAGVTGVACLVPSEPARAQQARAELPVCSAQSTPRVPPA